VDKPVADRTDAGSLTVANGQLQINDDAGALVGGLPLLMQLDDMKVPIAAQVQGNTATLSLDGSRAVYNPVALPFQEFAPWKTPYEREQAAWTRMTQTITMGAAIGAIVGAIGAGTAGCVLGGALGAVGGFAFLLPTGVGPVVTTAVGCLAGAVAFAPVGTLAGSILVGAPVAIAAAIQYITTINEPMAPRTS